MAALDSRPSVNAGQGATKITPGQTSEGSCRQQLSTRVNSGSGVTEFMKHRWNNWEEFNSGVYLHGPIALLQTCAKLVMKLKKIRHSLIS